MFMAQPASHQKLVAIMLPCLLTGGTEVVTLDTARALQELGFAVDIVVYFDEVDPVMLDAFTQAGTTVRLLGVRRDGGAKATLQLALALVRLLIRKRYSLIWLQYMTPTLIPLLVARCFTSRLVAAVHVAAGHYNPQGIRRIRWLARYWCTRFVCVSHTVASGIFGGNRSAGIYSRRVVVIPNSLDTREADAALPRHWRDELSWPEDRPIVGYCGRLAAIKGADILVEAVAMLIRDGHRVGLVVVGEGEERIKLQSLATTLGIGDDVYFAGRIARAEVFSAFKGFDIAVVPSREEGFGLSALEAMASGVPVVASNVDALAEIISDGVNGILFCCSDAIDLASRISLLLQNPELGANLARSAARHVSESYGIGQFRSQMADMLAATGLQVKWTGDDHNTPQNEP